MISKELKEILSKYSESNLDEISNINLSIDQITTSLKSIKNNIQKQLDDILSSDDINDDGFSILKDINSLKKYIGDINASIIDISKYTPFNNNVVEPDVRDDDILRFSGKVKAFLVYDYVCPICGVKMVPHAVDYEVIYDNRIIERKVKWYRCPTCNKIFVLYSDIENFDTKKTNIEISTAYVQKISIYEDIYVVNDICRCTSSHHHIKDITCILPIIMPNGIIDVIEITLAYCEECNKYVMLKYTYENLPGVPVCKIIDETKTSNQSVKEEFSFGDSESKLTRYGYNVNCVANLTKEQRHSILSTQLMVQNMQRSEIISILSKNIANGEKRIAAGYKKDWSNAVNKWKSDREFITNFDMDKQYYSLNINRIILKYTN